MKVRQTCETKVMLKKEKALALVDILVEESLTGKTLDVVCEKIGVSPRTIFELMRDHPEFENRLSRARAISAYYMEGKLFDESQRDDVHPGLQRNRMDALKWSIGLRNRPVFGERIDMTVNHGFDFKGVLNAADQRVLPLFHQTQIESSQAVDIIDVIDNTDTGCKPVSKTKDFNDLID